MTSCALSDPGKALFKIICIQISTKIKRIQEITLYQRQSTLVFLLISLSAWVIYFFKNVMFRENFYQWVNLCLLILVSPSIIFPHCSFSLHPFLSPGWRRMSTHGYADNLISHPHMYHTPPHTHTTHHTLRPYATHHACNHTPHTQTIYHTPHTHSPHVHTTPRTHITHTHNILTPYNTHTTPPTHTTHHTFKVSRLCFGSCVCSTHPPSSSACTASA